jgi:hypothetical protein
MKLPSVNQRIILTGWLLACALLPAAGQQLRPGEWRAYLSHRLAYQSLLRGNVVYTLTSGGLFTYDTLSRETRAYSTVDGLSSVPPSSLYYIPEYNRIVIGYADGSLDYFSELDDIRYLPDIRRNTFFTDKRINGFSHSGTRLFVATNFGLIVYSLDNNLPITDVTQFAGNQSRLPVTSVATGEGKVWVTVQGKGLYSAPLSAANLRDPQIWAFESGGAGLPAGTNIRQVAAADRLYVQEASAGVYVRNGLAWEAVPDLAGAWDRIYVSTGAVGASRISDGRVRYDNGIIFPLSVEGGIQHIASAGIGRAYVSTAFFGAVEVISFTQTRISPNGPQNNNSLRLAVGGGDVYVAPGGYDQIYTPVVSGEGIYYFNGELQAWEQLDQASGRLPAVPSTGFARAYFDAEAGQAWLGSWGAGLLRLASGQVEAAYTCENSSLSIITEPCNPSRLDNTRVSGIDRDPFGNLWVSQDFARDPLAVQTAAGAWQKIPGFRFPANHHIVDLMADDLGNVWMINSEQGLLVYTSNGTPEVLDDGRLISLRAGVNQGGLPTNEVTALALDQDGFVWVGTTEGVVVYYDPFSISQGSIVDAGTPAFDRTALLSNTTVNAIAVDGGNRKWFATRDGAFLLSENGDEVIRQFTEENSPLLSNEVLDIQIDPESGEVFMATDRGLISYQGDATEGERDCSSILVYPNPLFSDYEGPIVIEGTTTGSSIKITSASGLLVREIESQGGRAVWDGRDVYGEKLRSGIYLALIADRNGEKGCVGKFTVIRR